MDTFHPRILILESLNDWWKFEWASNIVKHHRVLASPPGNMVYPSEDSDSIEEDSSR